jgi:hypothetical protein
MIRPGLSTICVFIFPTILFAQAGTPKGPSGSEVVAHFIDGSVIRRVRLVENIDVQTRYGKLSIPVQDVRRIEFATRLPEEIARQIERAIDNLGNKTFAQREAASRELATLGARAHPAVKRASASPDKEVARRAREILAQIEQAVPAAQLRPREQDMIYTGDSVLTGQVLTPSLKARTNTFGETQLAVAELQIIHLETQVRSLTLEGTSFAPGDRRWIDTGIILDAGTDVRISTTGEMDVCPRAQPGQHRSGPDGNPSTRMADGTCPGMLQARIGQHGTPFIIGSMHQAKALTGSGKLYLSVVPFPGEQMQGSYQVRVTAGLGIGIEVPQPPAVHPPTSASLNFGFPAPAPPVAAPAVVAPGFFR